MLNKFLFPLLIVIVLFGSCDSNLSQSNQADKNIGTAAVSTKGAVFQSTTDTSLLPLDDILPKDGVEHIQKTYFDTLTYNNKLLLFATRDSALTVYEKRDLSCVFLLKIPIDSTDLYTYTDGSPVFLQDMDGDNQKEVLVTVYKNGNYSKHRVYRLVTSNGLIGLKKLGRFEDLINPEFDPQTSMVRSHWLDRNDYELDEFYTLSKDDSLVFVKGLERKNGKVSKYTRKTGW